MIVYFFTCTVQYSKANGKFFVSLSQSLATAHI